jgi:hypothetical protein
LGQKERRQGKGKPSSKRYITEFRKEPQRRPKIKIEK